MGKQWESNGKTMGKQWGKNEPEQWNFLSQNQKNESEEWVRTMGHQWETNGINMGILFGSREHGNNGKTMGKQWDKVWLIHGYFSPIGQL
jgi:hypothetical protein